MRLAVLPAFDDESAKSQYSVSFARQRQRMTNIVLRFDMRCPSFGTPSNELYSEAISMCEWGDQNGFNIVQFSEHHGVEDGYLPSPIVLGAAVAARTEQMLLRFALITLPFHDPLRIAEDLAVLDNISNGRVHAIFGGGYALHEFDMFGISPKDRPQLMEEGIQTIRRAWRGEAFEYQGRQVRITPTPIQPNGPEIWMGGNSPAAARRAARICQGFYTAEKDLYQHYFDEATRLGQKPTPWWDIGFGFLHVSEDPEKTWQAIGPFLAHELNSYSEWTAQITGEPFQALDVDTVRATGLYPVLTPEQAIEYAKERGTDGNVTLHPLCGGMPPELGWESLRLFVDEVLPAINPA